MFRQRFAVELSILWVDSINSSSIHKSKFSAPKESLFIISCFLHEVYLHNSSWVQGSWFYIFSVCFLLKGRILEVMAEQEGIIYHVNIAILLKRFLHVLCHDNRPIFLISHAISREKSTWIKVCHIQSMIAVLPRQQFIAQPYNKFHILLHIFLLFLNL